MLALGKRGHAASLSDGGRCTPRRDDDRFPTQPYRAKGIERMYYLLFYKTVDDYVAKRAPYRDEHLAYATAAHERGELVIAGALADPSDGAVLVFKAESPTAAESFAQGDPYVKNGLITEWNVRPWTVVIGG